jgi:hypothetical protein
MTDELNFKERKTADELAESMWVFYHNGAGSDHGNMEYLLRDFLTAGKLELAMELLKFHELERISTDIEAIKERMEEVETAIQGSLDNVAACVNNVQL